MLIYCNHATCTAVDLAACGANRNLTWMLWTAGMCLYVLVCFLFVNDTHVPSGSDSMRCCCRHSHSPLLCICRLLHCHRHLAVFSLRRRIYAPAAAGPASGKKVCMPPQEAVAACSCQHQHCQQQQQQRVLQPTQGGYSCSQSVGSPAGNGDFTNQEARVCV